MTWTQWIITGMKICTRALGTCIYLSWAQRVHVHLL